MKMIELIGGLVVGGIAGVALKDKIVCNSSKNDAKQRELDTLYAENEKFRKRNKDAERQIEDLLSELEKVRRKAKENDDEQDDLEDELNKAKHELKSLRQQNDDLARKVKEYKDACEAQAAQISLMKEKMG